jgi:hypothetical protein
MNRLKVAVEQREPRCPSPRNTSWLLDHNREDLSRRDTKCVPRPYRVEPGGEAVGTPVDDEQHTAALGSEPTGLFRLGLRGEVDEGDIEDLGHRLEIELDLAWLELPGRQDRYTLQAPDR